MCDGPDLSGGILREQDGQRRFLRLWPDPVFLGEAKPGIWTDLQVPDDDFNSSTLKKVRGELMRRYRPDYPEIVETIESGRELEKGSEVPHALQYLAGIDRRIRRREELLGPIPPHILQTIRRYPSEHFRLLQFLARHPSARELMDSNPPLGFMAVTHQRWRADPAPVPADVVEDVISWKRRDILAWLGFSNTTESLVRIMGKVAVQACRPVLLAALRQAVSNPETLRRLAHLSRINLGVATIIVSSRMLDRVTNKFLQDLAVDPAEEEEPRSAVELEVCLRLASESRWPRRVVVFDKPIHVRKTLWSLAAQLSPEDIETFNIALPPPPIPDMATIQALRTPEAVAEEADEQFNCVRSLLPRIAAGHLYLYRVLAPERATLSVRVSGSRCQFDQVECAFNTPAGEDTIRHVEEWISRASSC